MSRKERYNYFHKSYLEERFKDNPHIEIGLNSSNADSQSETSWNDVYETGLEIYVSKLIINDGLNFILWKF